MKKSKKTRKRERRREEQHAWATAKAWDLFEEAQDVVDERDLPLAIQLLTQATKYDPSHCPAYLLLALICNETEDYNLALSSLWKAKMVNPHYPPIYYYLSQTYLGLRRIEDAIQACERCISLLKGKQPLSRPEKEIKEKTKKTLVALKAFREREKRAVAVAKKLEKKELKVDEHQPGQRESRQQESQPTLEEILDHLRISRRFSFRSSPDLMKSLNKGDYDSFEAYNLRAQAAEISLVKGFDRLLCLGAMRGVRKLWYQIETVKKTLKYFRGRVLLCDEVGLGKTVEAGMILKEYLIRGLIKRILILVPPSLVLQWKEEMHSKFNLDFVTTEDSFYQQEKEHFWKKNRRVIASLNLAKSRKNAEIITGIEYDMVIVDEAHHLKNRRTINWKFVNALKKRFILLLSATPVQNNLLELHNLITLLKPGHLRTASSFRKSFVARGDPRVPQNREKLRELLSEVMIRNTRSLANLNLPHRYATTIKLEPTPKEEQFYQLLSAFVRESYHTGDLDKFTCMLLQMEAGSSTAAVSTTLSRLIARGRVVRDRLPQTKKLLELSGAVVTRKTEKLIEILGKTKDKVIVFTRYRPTQDVLASVLEKQGVSLTLFHGSLSSQEKERNITLFQDKVKVLISSEIGGEGKNLHFCNTIINYDLPWNPMRIEQRVGRLHRIGQSRDVFIFNLAAARTVEDYLLEILDKKINMFELVIGEMDAVLGNLDESKDFAEIVMDIWVGENTEREFGELGERLVEAKKRHLEIKRYDEEIFQHDYEL